MKMNKFMKQMLDEADARTEAKLRAHEEMQAAKQKKTEEKYDEMLKKEREENDRKRQKEREENDQKLKDALQKERSENNQKLKDALQKERDGNDQKLDDLEDPLMPDPSSVPSSLDPPVLVRGAVGRRGPSSGTEGGAAGDPEVQMWKPSPSHASPIRPSPRSVIPMVTLAHPLPLSGSIRSQSDGAAPSPPGDQCWGMREDTTGSHIK